jgi:DNA-binding CsgD family transcriptional regulator
MGTTPAPASGLLEREVEIGRLADLLDESISGGSVALVRGPAGIGKTALLRETVKAARDRGRVVLEARGVELERALAFGVARRLFEAHLAGLAATERDAILGGAAALAVPVVGSATAVAPSPREASGAVLHGLYWLAANLAARAPMVLAVDDAHWVDEATLRWLAYLGERLDDVPILLLLASRDGEPGDARVIRSLAERQETAVVVPAPLSVSAVTALAGVALDAPDAEVALACHHVTAGNPFLISELLIALQETDSMPGSNPAATIEALSTDAIARSVLPRLARLGPDATSVAKAAAVLGQDGSLAAIAGVSGLDLAATTRAVDRLAHAQILAGSARFDFVHPMLRTTVYADLPPGERLRLHAAAAAELERTHARPAAIAAHLLEAPAAGSAGVVEILRVAAAESLGFGDAVSAIRLLRRALDEPPAPSMQPTILLELGTAEGLAADPAAIGHLDDALRVATDPEVVARAARGLGDALTRVGELGRAETVVAAAADRIRSAAPGPAFRLDLEALLVARLDFASQPDARDRWSRFFRSPPPAGSEEARILDAVRSFAEAAGGAPSGRVERLAGRALGDGELLSAVGPTSSVFHSAVQALCLAERFELAAMWWERALEAARARGSVIGYGMACCYQAGFISLRLGDLVAAEDEARQAHEIAATHAQQLWLAEATAHLAEILVARGAIEEASQILATVPVPDPLPGRILFEPLIRAVALRDAAVGETKSAIEGLRTYGHRMKAWGSPDASAFEWRCTSAELLASAGNTEEALAIVEREVVRAEAAGTPLALGMALRAQALAQPAGVDIVGLRRAEETLSATRGRLEHARTLVELGAALRRSGQRTEARAPLAQAYDIAGRAGAAPLSERAHTELLACGARPRRTALIGADSLTASERRVADMAVRGKSNVEIAQTLFVTRKTVEKHLGNAYLKLGVTGRGDLAGALDNAAKR